MILPYLVLPTIIGLELVRNLTLHVMWKRKVGSRDCELRFDLFDSDAMIDEAEEANGLRCFQQLFNDLWSAVIEIWD